MSFGAPPMGQPPVAAVFGFANLHPESNVFNDFVTVKAEEMRGSFKKILRVVGYYHQKSVVGLEFVYQLSTGQTVLTTHNIPHENFLTKMVGSISGKHLTSSCFDVAEGDYIDRIQACFNEKKVVYLVFSTYRGNKCAFGFPRGEPITVGNPGYTFGPAKGGYEKERLNYIIFPAATIPENIGFNAMMASQVARPISPMPNLVRPVSPGGMRPLSPMATSSCKTTITQTTVGGSGIGVSGGPPIPPLTGSQALELDMKLSRLNNSTMSTAQMHQQLLMQQQQVGAQLQQQQAQIQYHLQQIQQQQQIEIQAQMERQQLMRIQEMELERNKQREVIFIQKQELERLMAMHNVDQQTVISQQHRVEALLRVQSERERIHAAQMAEMKALQIRQAQQLQMIRTQQIQVHDGGIDIMKRQLEEQQMLERKHKMDMMRQLEMQLNEQKTLQARQSTVKPTGDFTISASTATNVSNSGSQLLIQSTVRPVSPNSLAPPGQVPIPQVIHHPGMNQFSQGGPQGPQGPQGWGQPQPGYGYQPQQGQHPPQGPYAPQQGGYPPQQGGYPPQQGPYQQQPYPPQGWPAQGGPPSPGLNQPSYQGGNDSRNPPASR